MLSAFTTVWAANELSSRRAPGFSLPDGNIKQHDLADYRGKVVLLNFMKTDCPHCGAFSKVLAAAQEKYGDRLQVLSVVNTPPETQKTVQGYLAEHGIDLLMLFDCRQVAYSYFKLSPQRKSFEVPHFFVIDRRGWIREDYGYNVLNRGIFEEDDLFPIIERYIAKPARAD
jgi:peroxiredoxin